MSACKFVPGIFFVGRIVCDVEMLYDIPPPDIKTIIFLVSLPDVVPSEIVDESMLVVRAQVHETLK